MSSIEPFLWTVERFSRLTGKKMISKNKASSWNFDSYHSSNKNYCSCTLSYVLIFKSLIKVKNILLVWKLKLSMFLFLYMWCLTRKSPSFYKKPCMTSAHFLKKNKEEESLPKKKLKKNRRRRRGDAYIGGHATTTSIQLQARGGTEDSYAWKVW